MGEDQFGMQLCLLYKEICRQKFSSSKETSCTDAASSLTLLHKEVLQEVFCGVLMFFAPSLSALCMLRKVHIDIRVYNTLTFFRVSVPFYFIFFILYPFFFSSLIMFSGIPSVMGMPFWFSALAITCLFPIFACLSSIEADMIFIPRFNMMPLIPAE